MHFESGVGHIGGNLSCLSAVAHLHARVMRDDDVFVLSKGHAAGALYVTLWALGELTDDDLQSFHRDDTHLSGHPAANWHPGIRFATGSLGHGLGLSAGIALAKRLRGEPGKVYCLLSDGECQEGSTWEGVIFAHHQALDGLIVLIDANGLQGFGTTDEVASMTPLRDRFRGFGVQTAEISGDSMTELDRALVRHPQGPLFVIMHTVKGRGVSFMENRMEWHYLPLKPDDYRRVLEELERSESS
jgi:transketolase